MGNACLAVLGLQAPSAFSIVGRVTDAAVSHSHVSETGDASLSTLDIAPAQRLLAVCCPIAQRRVDMNETKLVKLDEVNPACDLGQTSSKRSAYMWLVMVDV